MPIKYPQTDLPYGITGGSDLWDQPQASVLLTDDYFEIVSTGLVVNEAASTGAIFTTVGNYRIATFNSSGSLVVTSGGSAEALIVGGGGSGGGNRGGGGGGGEVIPLSSVNLAPGSYSVIVGSGGAQSGAFDLGNNGQPSSFAGFEADGGGGGAGSNTNGANGGSGGGGAHVGNLPGGTSTATPPGLGNPGGSGGGGNHGGGGGGAGSAGESAGADFAGDGGDGFLSSISGTARRYGAGGGGGAGGIEEFGITRGRGGLGGGGDGAYQPVDNGIAIPAAAGQPNSGSGGGGGVNLAREGAPGGSGVVIVRWLIEAGGPAVHEGVLVQPPTTLGPIVAPAPAGTVATDLLVAVVRGYITARGIIPPSGWTLVGSVAIAFGDLSQSVYTAPGNVTNFTWNQDSNPSSSVVIEVHRISGADLANPVRNFAFRNSENDPGFDISLANMPSPSVNAEAGDCILSTYWQPQSDSAIGATPANYSLVVNESVPNRKSTVVRSDAPAGATGEISFSANAPFQSRVGFTIAIRSGGAAPQPIRRLKYWNGTTWSTGVLKRWNGTAWVESTLKYWNGTTWV